MKLFQLYSAYLVTGEGPTEVVSTYLALALVQMGLPNTTILAAARQCAVVRDEDTGLVFGVTIVRYP